MRGRVRATGTTIGTGWIHGRIVAGDTGKPLSRAWIRLSASELGRDPLWTSTNADGRYEINDLPAARYTLSVTRSGLPRAQLRPAPPARAGDPLELLDKERLDHTSTSRSRR